MCWDSHAGQDVVVLGVVWGNCQAMFRTEEFSIGNRRRGQSNEIRQDYHYLQCASKRFCEAAKQVHSDAVMSRTQHVYEHVWCDVSAVAAEMGALGHTRGIV